MANGAMANAATSKTLRNKKRRTAYKLKHVRKPRYLDRVNSYALVFKYADSFRSPDRQDFNGSFFRRRMLHFGPSFAFSLRRHRRLRLRHRRKNCLGFVIHGFYPSYSSGKRVVGIQGFEYAKMLGLSLPLPKKRKLRKRLRQIWYSLTTKINTKGLWKHEAGKHGVYYQLSRKDDYWETVMKLAGKFLGKDSDLNLLNLLWKKG